jgi:hypothetical protein
VARFSWIRDSTILLPAPSWHDGRKRGTMLRIPEHYLRLLLEVFECGFEQETWEYKRGNFRVECLCSEVLLGGGEHCNHLG